MRGSNGHAGAHAFAFSRRISPELCFVATPRLKEGAGKTGCRPGTHGPLCEGLRYKRLHSGIQVEPNTRPSLRSGWNGVCRALPGERCTIAPVASRMIDARARLGRHITARLGAQTPGARTTRFGRTSITPVVRALVPAHGCPPCEIRRADVTHVHRPPVHVRDDRDTPLFLGPGCGDGYAVSEFR